MRNLQYKQSNDDEIQKNSRRNVNYKNNKDKQRKRNREARDERNYSDDD